MTKLYTVYLFTKKKCSISWYIWFVLKEIHKKLLDLFDSLKSAFCFSDLFIKSTTYV